MNKKDFIQRCLIAWMPHFKNDLQCIERSEKAWQALSEKGYGATNESTPEELKTTNYYAMIQDQELFDKCWHKYGKEGARNEAAKAWLKLEESDKATIYQAVVKYLEQLQHSGVTKAHFSTWLNQRRFESFEPDMHEKKQPAAFSERAQEIQYFQKMIAIAKDENTKAALQSQLDRLMT